MVARTNANLIDGAERILEDGTANVIFSATDLAAELQADLSELSEYSPWEIVQTKLMEASTRLGEQQGNQRGRNKGREVDISDIENLIDLKVEYPIGHNPPLFRDYTRYGGKLYIDIASRPTPCNQNDSFGDLQVLTGTVTFTSASTAVSGSGTAFLSELEVGYYISPSGSNNWYRVASITDDDNLIISINCHADDTGADTEDSTRYWFEYINLWCKKNHYVEATVTDFAGAIDSGAATGYAQDTYRIHVDGLGASDVIKKDTLFTIAGTLGVYRVTADATMSTSEGDLIIEPRLKERAAEDAVITFLGSSLNQNEERLLMELVAARSALNWVGDARTAADSAVSAIALGNAEIDKITARITALTTATTGVLAKMLAASFANASSVTAQIADAETELDSAAAACAAVDAAIGDYTTTATYAVTEMGLADDAAAAIDTAVGLYLAASGEAELALEACNTALDSAVVNIGVVETAKAAEDTKIDTAITAVITQLGNAATDLTTDVDAVNNTITIGSNVTQNIISKAMGEISTARGYIANADALKTPNEHYAKLAIDQINLSIAQIREAQNYITLENAVVSENAASARTHIATGQGYIALEGAVVNENALSVRSYVSTAQGYVREAAAYMNFDAQQTSNYARVVSSELQTVGGYLQQAGGYFQEANTSLRASSAINAINRWAQLKLQEVKSELRKLKRPNQKRSYPR